LVGACLALVAWQLGVLGQRLLGLVRWQQLGQLGLGRQRQLVQRHQLRQLGQQHLLLGQQLLRQLVGRPGSSLASFP
jgi:hypothetical protein